jgi:hypothetical protein
VQDKIYAGHQALLYSGELVDRSKALCTGAYLYGLIALDICLVMYPDLCRANKQGLRRSRSDRSESIYKRLP